jgi:hypothetical protein
MSRRNARQRSPILTQQLQGIRSDHEQARTVVGRVLAAVHDPLINQFREFPADRGARANAKQKKLLDGHGAPALLLISYFDHDVEIDNGLKEGQLYPLELAYFSKASEQGHCRIFTSTMLLIMRRIMGLTLRAFKKN